MDRPIDRQAQVDGSAVTLSGQTDRQAGTGRQIRGDTEWTD